MICDKSENTVPVVTELKRIRRMFHRYPETAWLEMRTSALVAEYLKKLGYEVLIGKAVCKEESRMGLPEKEQFETHYRKTEEYMRSRKENTDYLPMVKDGFTGVIGILRCGEGPVTALRFDIDALPIGEAEEKHFPKEEGFSSEIPGSMHACGHDGHIAIGLGAAYSLSQHKDSLHGTIKLIFQPAEEGVRGAKAIVENGHLDDVDFLLGGHLMASVDNSCYIAPGMAGTLATTKINAVFYGKSAHAGMCPQNGVNALVAAATAVLNLQAIPRTGEGASRINVGTLHAGTGRNVVCDNAKMELEVRGDTTEINRYMERYAMQILKSSAQMHSCSLKTEIAGYSGAITCSDSLIQKVKKICLEDLHIPTREAVPLGGSEDFACMSDRVLARGGEVCFNGIHTPVVSTFHSSEFDFDESVLEIAVSFYVGIAEKFLTKIG